jgi:tetratricopeptide (TPR) repeat protein
MLILLTQPTLAQIVVLPVITRSNSNKTSPTSSSDPQLRINQLIEQGNFSEAEKACQLAIADAKTHADPKILASCYGCLAMVYRKENRYDECLNEYQKLLEYWQKQSDDKYFMVSYILNNIGEVYSSQGQYSKALPLVQDALSKITEESPNYCVVTSHLASIYLYMEMLTEAEKYLNKSIIAAQRISDTGNLAEFLGVMAILYFKQGRISESKIMLAKAIKANEQHFGPQSERVLKLKQLQTAMERY